MARFVSRNLSILLLDMVVATPQVITRFPILEGKSVNIKEISVHSNVFVREDVSTVAGQSLPTITFQFARSNSSSAPDEKGYIDAMVLGPSNNRKSDAGNIASFLMNTYMSRTYGQKLVLEGVIWVWATLSANVPAASLRVEVDWEEVMLTELEKTQLSYSTY